MTWEEKGMKILKDVGSIPIARSINPIDAVEFTGFLPPKFPIRTRVLDAVGRGIRSQRASWTRRFGIFHFSDYGVIGTWIDS
jgi:hypothetical protein